LKQTDEWSRGIISGPTQKKSATWMRNLTRKELEMSEMEKLNQIKTTMESITNWLDQAGERLLGIEGGNKEILESNSNKEKN
jgi:hypothetical protein